MQKHPEKELIKIIARYVDGKIIKGYTFDFFPNKPYFHISPSIFETPKEGNKVLLNELKAVFFVKDFEGNPSYNERKDYKKDSPYHWVIFEEKRTTVYESSGLIERVKCRIKDDIKDSKK